MPIRSLILWPTGGCNLDCSYCYRGIRYGAMSPAVAHAAVDLMAAEGVSWTLQFAGGEPTLNPGLVTEIATRVRTEQLPATIAVQTNATTLSAGLVAAWHELGIEFGISLDGPPELHQRLRGRARETYAGLGLLARMGVPVRVTTVVSAVNVASLGRLALILAGFGNVQGLALDPLVNLGSAVGRSELVSAAEAVEAGIGELHRTLRGLWLAGSRLRWRELDRVRGALQGPMHCGPFCHAQRASSLAVAPDGSVYPCSQAVGDPRRRAGRIDAVDRARLAAQFTANRLSGPCQCCPLQGRCPGDCPSRIEADPGRQTSTTCQIYRAIARLEGVSQ